MVAAAPIRPLSSSFSACSFPSFNFNIKKSTVFISAGTTNASKTTPAAADPPSMDPGCAFKLLLSYPSGLPRSQVLVDFNARYDRIPHPDPELEESINEYGGHSLHCGEESEQESSVCLHLSLTDYRTFVGTNLNPNWEKFLVSSEDDALRCQHTSSPLGNGAIVETTDNKIIVLRRSNNVGEFPGYFVFPGGHSEPHEIGISSHQIGSNLAESAGLLHRKVAEEMFEGIIRKVVEEVGAPAHSLCDPLFIGISCRDLNVRPTAFFYIKCNLGSEEINQLYSKAQDGYESTHLYTVSRNKLEKMALKMPGCHRGGYALYLPMVEVAKCVPLQQ